MTNAVMSEQTALVTRSTTDEVWVDRLVSTDPVPRLADTFLLNCQATPTEISATRLVHPQARTATGAWLLDTLRNPVEDALRFSPVTADPQRVTEDDIYRATAWPIGCLPDAYADWRLCVEIYLLMGQDLYLVLDRTAMPYRRLTEADMGKLWSSRTLPFTDLEDPTKPPTGIMTWLVGVPSRLAALGGLRGARGSLIEAGRAMAALSSTQEGATTEWEWTTEFYDDAACVLLGIDGLERVPVAVGVQKEVNSDE